MGTPQNVDAQAQIAAVMPVCVSQTTSLQVLGLKPRKFLDEVRRMGVPHTRLGKLVVCELADFLAALRRQRAACEQIKSGADGVLALIGRERKS